jgi:uncharacterized caspase-like protein
MSRMPKPEVPAFPTSERRTALEIGNAAYRADLLRHAVNNAGDIKYQSVQVDRVLDRMREAGNQLNVIIPDACRNNPYARNLRSAQASLAVIQAATGSLIAYATSSGTTAEDGAGCNGTYTKHLLHFVQKPSLSAEQMFKEVHVAVAQETGKEQIPWASTSLLGDFYSAGRYAARVRLFEGDGSVSAPGHAQRWRCPDGG